MDRVAELRHEVYRGAVIHASADMEVTSAEGRRIPKSEADYRLESVKRDKKVIERDYRKRHRMPPKEPSNLVGRNPRQTADMRLVKAHVDHHTKHRETEARLQQNVEIDDQIFGPDGRPIDPDA